MNNKVNIRLFSHFHENDHAHACGYDCGDDAHYAVNHADFLHALHQHILDIENQVAGLIRQQAHAGDYAHRRSEPTYIVVGGDDKNVLPLVIYSRQGCSKDCSESSYGVLYQCAPERYSHICF